MRYNIPKIAFIFLMVAAIVFFAGTEDPQVSVDSNVPPATGERQETTPPPVDTEPAPADTPESDSENIDTVFNDSVEVVLPVHDFTAPIAESDPVEDSWFNDAVFLGDSRTDGFRIFSGLKTGTYFCNTGLSVFHVAGSERHKVLVNGEEMSVLDALATGVWSKVYIMFGTNDLGCSAEAYEDGLKKLVDNVLELQPQAVIYLQTMPPVNEAQARANKLSSYVTNGKINQFNEAILRVAAEKQVAVVDVAACLRSETGDLPEKVSSDGVHFYKGGYQTWLAYLRTHTLDNSIYHSSRETADTTTEAKEAAA